MCLFPFTLGHVWVDCRLFRDEAFCVLACGSGLRAAPEAVAMETRGSEGGLEEILKLKLVSPLLCWDPSAGIALRAPSG